MFKKKREHPVWEVYDLQRDCRLNVKYWSKKLVKIRRINSVLEYFTLVTASGSAVAVLPIWQNVHGRVIWQGLTVITASLCIAKPLLKLSDKVANLQDIVTQYRTLDSQLEQLGNNIRRLNEYSQVMVSNFQIIVGQVDKIIPLEPIEVTDTKLQKECFEQVNRELPEDSFYLPPI